MRPDPSMPNDVELEQLVTRATALVEQIRYQDYSFHVKLSHGGVYLRAAYPDQNIITGFWEAQWTRRWPLTALMTDSEIVQTAFKCVLTSAEHRVREAFLFQGQRVYSPHYNVYDLVALASKRSDSGGRDPEAQQAEWPSDEVYQT